MAPTSITIVLAFAQGYLPFPFRTNAMPMAEVTLPHDYTTREALTCQLHMAVAQLCRLPRPSDEQYTSPLALTHVLPARDCLPRTCLSTPAKRHLRVLVCTLAPPRAHTSRRSRALKPRALVGSLAPLHANTPPFRAHARTHW